MFDDKAEFLLKVFVFCLLVPAFASCQISSLPKTKADKSPTVSNQSKTNQTTNKPVETALPSPVSTGTIITRKDVAQKGQRIEDFSPKEWYLMMKAEGDLNGDNLPDAVAAFSRAKTFDGTDESTHSSTQLETDINTERVLIIVLGTADGFLNLDELHQKIILCRTCGGQMDDTLLGLSIKNGSIEITQGTLGTSSAEYQHKIKKDSSRGWIVFYGEGKFRERRTGKDSSAGQKEPILLADFDIAKETEKL